MLMVGRPGLSQLMHVIKCDQRQLNKRRLGFKVAFVGWVDPISKLLKRTWRVWCVKVSVQVSLFNQQRHLVATHWRPLNLFSLFWILGSRLSTFKT